MIEFLKNTKWLAPILPAGSAGMFYLASMALFFPESEQGTQFLNSVGGLFEIEFIFMHSAIFFQMRNAITKSKIMYWLFTGFLLLVYTMFMQTFANDNPIVWGNYILLTVGRILFPLPTRVPRLLSQKLGIDLETYQKISWAGALLKAGFFLTLIPLVIFVLPIPDFALSPEKVDALVTSPHSAKDLLDLVKVFWLFYFTQTIYEFRATLLTIFPSASSNLR